ncbi:hypothetical protein DFS34DRAFT_593037 [Phlyctochytrium arcticum]|nr:hypothetical protein DFS34DRAFT_593037 [Phlyctochytrium arcticum]
MDRAFWLEKRLKRAYPKFPNKSQCAYYYKDCFAWSTKSSLPIRKPPTRTTRECNNSELDAPQPANSPALGPKYRQAVEQIPCAQTKRPRRPSASLLFQDYNRLFLGSLFLGSAHGAPRHKQPKPEPEAPLSTFPPLLRVGVVLLKLFLVALPVEIATEIGEKIAKIPPSISKARLAKAHIRWARADTQRTTPFFGWCAVPTLLLLSPRNTDPPSPLAVPPTLHPSTANANSKDESASAGLFLVVG